jgi:hypothetical protein
MKKNLNLTLLIFSIFLLIIIIYYYQLELASLLYLGINVLINNLESINSYLKDYLEIDNPVTEDNSIKEISEDLDNNLNKSSITININHIDESIPFYKSKTFIICGIIIISSGLLYFYYYNSILSLKEIEESKLVNRLLDIINQKDSKLLDIIYQKDMKFYENNNKLVDIIEQKDKLIDKLRESNINLLEEKVQLLESELGKTHRRWEYFKDHMDNILD